MQAIFDKLVTLLPAAWQDKAKAFVPVVLGVIAIVSQWAATGTFDQTEILTAVGALITALGVFKARNLGPTVPPPDNDGVDVGAEEPKAA